MMQARMTGRHKWRREETLAAFNLYSRTAFGRLHARNPEIIALAKDLDRTAGAVAMKCCNLAALDPTLQVRGIKGLRSISKLDRDIWEQFHQNAEALAYESELAFSEATKQAPRMVPEDDPIIMVAGTDRAVIRFVRITQHLFRAMILSSYGERCAICGLPSPRLLVASHIVGWALDPANRMNPRNGLCLCCMHDRAFDIGILDVDENLKIHVTDRCDVDRNHRVAVEMLYRFDSATISLPDRWQPDPALLLKRRVLLGFKGS